MDSTLEDEITDLIITDNNNVSSQVAKNNEVVISANESVSQVVSAANVNNVNDISKENLDSNIKNSNNPEDLYDNIENNTIRTYASTLYIAYCRYKILHTIISFFSDRYYF